MGERRRPKPELDRHRVRPGRVVRLVQPVRQQHTGGHGDHIADQRRIELRRGPVHVRHDGQHGQGARQVRGGRDSGRYVLGRRFFFFLYLFFKPTSTSPPISTRSVNTGTLCC